MPETRTRHTVCDETEIPEGHKRIVTVGGVNFGIFNVQGRLRAYRNTCPHQGAPVCLGRVGGTSLPTDTTGEYVFGWDGRVLHCPWHGWEFDLDTGSALFGQNVRLAKIPVDVEEGQIVIYLKERTR